MQKKDCDKKRTILKNHNPEPMSKCTIPINFSGDPEGLIRNAEQAISAAGGSFSGNNSYGKFAISSPLGKISGTFSVQGQSFIITITDKPFLVSCGRIETELKKHLGNL